MRDNEAQMDETRKPKLAEDYREVADKLEALADDHGVEFPDQGTLLVDWADELRRLADRLDASR
jgi:hypothetical protein